MLTSAKLEADAGMEQIAAADDAQHLPLVQSRGIGRTVFNILIWRDIIKDPQLLNGSRIHNLMMSAKARPGLMKALGFFLFVFPLSCGTKAVEVRHSQDRCK